MIPVKFYTTVSNFGTPQERISCLFRWYRAEAGLYLQQWNVHTKRWESSPGLIAVTGIGGTTNYERISYALAVTLIVERGGLAADLLPAGGEAEKI